MYLSYYLTLYLSGKLLRVLLTGSEGLQKSQKIPPSYLGSISKSSNLITCTGITIYIDLSIYLISDIVINYLYLFIYL
jgi:hypothetical protein